MKTRLLSVRSRCLLGAFCSIAFVACTQGSDEPAEGGAPTSAAEAPAPPAVAPPPAAPSDVTELFVDVEAEPDEGAPPLAVQFTAIVEDNTGAVECEWEMGDGSPKKKGMNPMHVFSTVEDYEILVRCTDAAGVEGEGEVDVFVEEE